MASIAQAGTGWILTTVTHRASEWYRVTVHPAHWPVSPTCIATACCGYYPERRTEEDPAQATKSLPVQPNMSAPDGNMAMFSVSMLITSGLQNPVSMEVPSTGMDMQYGSSDLIAYMMGSSNLQQQTQDGVFWIQLP